MKFKKRNIQIVDHSTGQTLDFPTFGKPAGEEAIADLERSVNDKIAELKTLVGTPLQASTISAMTNEEKIYVYTGSETGYTNGHWYYYDGSAWQDGGVYNSIAIETDKTLSIENMPADAKAVGTELAWVKEDLGVFKYSQNAKARLMTINKSCAIGDVLYFEPLAWSGDAWTQITLEGAVNGSRTTLARATALNQGLYLTADKAYDTFYASVNVSAVPVTDTLFEFILCNASLADISGEVFRNRVDILRNVISKGYYSASQPLLANCETTGAWLLVSARLAQLTDAPSGLSGDYILNVVRYNNGWFQELISLTNASEHHVRYVLSSTRTGTWNTYKYTTAFTSKGYITDTTLTNKNSLGSWLLVSEYVSGLTDAPEGLSGDYLLNVYPFGNGYAQELISLSRPAEKHIRYVMNSTGTGTWHSIYDEQIKIATFGDSITKGQIGGTSPAEYTDSGFVRAGKQKGYAIANYGIGGIGYSYTVNNHNALYEITNATLTGMDIVTLSFGVNDWQNNIPVGSVDDNTIDTMCGGMNLAIQKVIEKVPTATIIVFSPLNCTFKGGTAAGKWALGHSLATSGTLEDVFEAMKAVCDKYEIAFVDLTHGNPAVNCLNANNTGVLGDGLHPTVNTYKHLGRIIANYI